MRRRRFLQLLLAFSLAVLVPLLVAVADRIVTIRPGYRRSIQLPDGSGKWRQEPSVTMALGERIVVQPTTWVAPIPIPTPVPGPAATDLFMAPTGNDANPGTEASPKKTILAASALLKPGQTLWVRGGTYTGQGGYNWKSSGTAAAPVTIKAYPGETPTFSGGAFTHGIAVSSFNYVVIDGLTFTGYGKAPSGDGAILLLYATDVTIQNCTIRNTGVDRLDHSIYVNSGTDRVIIRNNTLHNSSGTQIVFSHGPGPRNILIEGNAIGNPDGTETAYGGVVVACTATGTTATIRNNVFRGITENNIQNCSNAGAVLTISGNDPSDQVGGVN